MSPVRQSRAVRCHDHNRRFGLRSKRMSSKRMRFQRAMSNCRLHSQLPKNLCRYSVQTSCTKEGATDLSPKLPKPKSSEISRERVHARCCCSPGLIAQTKFRLESVRQRRQQGCLPFFRLPSLPSEGCDSSKIYCSSKSGSIALVRMRSRLQIISGWYRP